MIQETKTTGILAVTLTIGSAPQQLPFGKPAFGCVTLTAPTTNTGIVYIANSEAGTRTGPRTTLVTGMPTDFHVSNIDSLYVSDSARRHFSNIQRSTIRRKLMEYYDVDNIEFETPRKAESEQEKGRGNWHESQNADSPSCCCRVSSTASAPINRALGIGNRGKSLGLAMGNRWYQSGHCQDDRIRRQHQERTAKM